MHNIEDKNFHQMQNQSHQSKQRSELIQKVQKINKKQKKPCIHWSSKENLKYLAFLMSNQADLGLQSTRKIWKIYKLMSEFVQTRDIHQCRSHHQKMIRKHDDIKELIEQLKLLASEKHLAKALKDYSQQFLQKPQKTNSKLIKPSLENQEMKSQAKQKKYPQQRQQRNLTLGENFNEIKQNLQKSQPIIKQQQIEYCLTNSIIEQHQMNYQMMPPCFNFPNPYCIPPQPYFFIYHP